MKSGSKMRVTMLDGADLAARDEAGLLLVQAVLEGLAGLGQRQQALVGAAGAEQAVVDGRLVGLVDIDHGAVGDVRLARMAGRLPVGEELVVARPDLVARAR